MIIQDNCNYVNSQQGLSLLAVFFKTENSHYIFDVNNVNFLEVNEIVFKILALLKKKQKSTAELGADLPEYTIEEIEEALTDIEEIQKQGFLKPHEFQRAVPFTLPEIKTNLTSNLDGLYLNITSQCNLNCSYCVFGGSYENLNFLEHQEMSWEVAQKAIEFFLSQSRREGTLKVDFFGGEPLLAFPLIERVVTTLKERLLPRKQDLKVIITSNGTLMTTKIADFLIAHRVYLQISIDGEKEIHDAKRKFKNSNIGSFDAVLKCLQLLYERDPEYYFDRLRLKAVLTTESLGTDGKDFINLPLIKKLNEVKHFSMVNQTPHYNVKKDEDFFSRIHLLGNILLQKRDVTSLEELLEGLDYKKKFLFYVTLYEFFPVQVFSSLHFQIEDPVPFIKGCLIGIEGCVNVDGSISICYKSNSFKIGSVLENTWYFDKIEEFHKKRYSQSNLCKSCFVQRFCKLCYEKISEKDDQLYTSIHNYCEFNCAYYRTIFEYMLQIMENNPLLWDELQRVAEVEKDGLLKRAREKKEKAAVLN